jgi:hypothetical protein
MGPTSATPINISSFDAIAGSVRAPSWDPAAHHVVDVSRPINLKTWNNPASLDLSNPLLGIVTGASGNRTMQAGLKLLF